MLSRYLFLTIAFLVLLFGILKIFVPRAYFVKRIDRDVLLYLGIASALILLRDIKSFSYGDYKIEFQRQLDSLGLAVRDASGNAIGRGKPSAEALQAAAPKIFHPGRDKDDQWKGVFGGKDAVNGRKLTANVRLINENWYGIELEVVSEDPNKPLTGFVQFFLHQTYRNDRPIITVQDGRAHLHIEAYGAFTVGAVADNGGTELELDLSLDSRFPRGFREN